MLVHWTRLISWFFVFVLAAVGMQMSVTPVCGGAVLEGVKVRGRLCCGIGEDIIGFSERDATGKWRGFNVDFCHAVAAAVLGDASKVEFVPHTTSMRFPLLQSRKIDLLVSNTTWTFAREAFLKLQFPAVLIYDSQALLVLATSGVTKIAELNGANVCVEKGARTAYTLGDYFLEQGLSVNPVAVGSAGEIAEALLDGRCIACAGPASKLAGLRAQLASSGVQDAKILPYSISKEPLCPVTLGEDSEWATIVRWVLYALILAEENGVAKGNVDSATVQKNVRLLRMQRGEHAKLAKAIGLPADWAVLAVKAVGNYGEMFDRNLGSSSPLNLERGLNRLWNDGGLMFSPPIE